MFNVKHRTRGNSSNYSTERLNQSVSHGSRFTKAIARRKKSGDGIIEQVDEEDKLSEDYDSADENAIRKLI